MREKEPNLWGGTLGVELGGSGGRAERGTEHMARLEEGRKEVFGMGKGFKVRVGVLSRSGNGIGAAAGYEEKATERLSEDA